MNEKKDFNHLLTTVIITDRFDARFWKAFNSVQWSPLLILIDPDAESKDKSKINAHISKIKDKYPQAQTVIGNLKAEDFSEVRDYALTFVKTDWTFFLDSDEWIDENLKDAIIQAILGHQSLDAYAVYRQDYFLGKPLQYGEPASVKLVRLGKTKKGQWQGKVHETWEFSSPVGELTSFLHHEPHTSLSEFISKINTYTTLVAEERIENSLHTSLWEMLSFPIGKFLQNYFLRSGWRDGGRGFIYALMMSFHSFFVRVKMWEMQTK